MTNNKKILVFTATYNERDNIGILIHSILTNCSYVDILIIDDNSPDKTFEKIQEEQNKYKNIFLLKRESKLGLDTAHKKAYDYAIKNNFNFPYLADETQEIAKSYGAVCTPDFFGYNKDLELQYRGRLRELKNLVPVRSGESDLLKAMKQIAETGKGPESQSPSAGCSIKWKNN